MESNLSYIPRGPNQRSSSRDVGKIGFHLFPCLYVLASFRSFPLVSEDLPRLRESGPGHRYMHFVLAAKCFRRPPLPVPRMLPPDTASSSAGDFPWRVPPCGAIPPPPSAPWPLRYRRHRARL